MIAGARRGLIRVLGVVLLATAPGGCSGGGGGGGSAEEPDAAVDLDTDATDATDATTDAQLDPEDVGESEPDTGAPDVPVEPEPSCDTCPSEGAATCEGLAEVRLCQLDVASGCLAWSAEALECDDGVECNGLEHCLTGQGCVDGTAPFGCCEADADCNVDDNICNGVEKCLEGLCQQVSGVLDCSGSGLPCAAAGVCDPTVGCVTGEAPQGCCLSNEACEDGNPCNGIGVCDLETETCSVGAPPGCDDGNPCNGTEVCDASVGCVQIAAPPECSDGNPCNGQEVCDVDAGCIPSTSPKLCDDGLACNGLESCDPLEGCVAGTPQACDDDNLCNGQETCDQASGCQSGLPLDCDDDNACNGQESCDPQLGCVKGEALGCNDGKVCNGQEICDAFAGCLSGTPFDCDDGNACDGLESCDQEVGCVEGDPLDCDDGDFCDDLDACDPFVGCVSSPSPNCSDGNPCDGVGACDPLVGCVTDPPPACDDGDACDGVESCVPFLGCQSGTALSCDDGLACTSWDACDDDLGCLPGELDCDDGDACTEDLCDLQGACEHLAVDCDDGDGCTADGCNAGTGCSHDPGAANGIGCLPGDACFVAGVCTGGQCVPSQALDCGDYPGGATACAEGACTFTCEEGLGDCDGEQANGCEVALGESAEHCGACGEACGTFEVCSLSVCADQCAEGLQPCGGQCFDISTHEGHCGGCFDLCDPAQALGICAEGDCQISQCQPGWVDADTEAASGCECPYQGPEKCDGEDDDCDGETDEGFDLESDPANCGGCGMDCGDLPGVAETACVAKNCDIVECAEGLKDEDGLTSNGCEGVVDVWWVDTLATGAETQDGSFDHPFATFPQALEVALPYDQIRVQEGVYGSGHVVATPNLRIHGAGREVTTLALQVQAHAVEVYDVGIVVGATSAVGANIPYAFTSPGGGPLQGGRLERVRVQHIQHTNGATAYGVHCLSTQGLELRDVIIEDLWDSGPDSAILLQQCPGALLEDLTISGVKGGPRASGIHAIDSPGLTLRDSTVQGIAGRAGTSGSKAQGFAAYGILFEGDAKGAQLEGNAFSDLAGGAHSQAGNNLPAPAYCLGVAWPPPDIEVAMDNTCEGAPIVFLVDPEPVEVSGVIIPQTGASPSSLGALVVYGGNGVVLEGNTVLAYHAPADEPPELDVPPFGAGILIHGCSGCTVRDNIVLGVFGAPPHNVVKHVGTTVAGIAIQASQDVVVQDNLMAGMVGGELTIGKLTQGGDAWGLWVEGTQDALLEGNHVESIRAGRGNSDGGSGIGWAGEAIGVLIESSLDVELSRTVGAFRACAPGNEVGSVSSHVRINDSTAVTLDHLTLWDLDPDCLEGLDEQAALHVTGSATDVTLVNSILGKSKRCILNEAAAGAPALEVSYTYLAECDEEVAGEILEGEGMDSAPNGVLFVDPAADLHLVPESTAIDLADPSAPFCEEPQPNGGRANLGAYGGTAEATPGVDAVEGDCP